MTGERGKPVDLKALLSQRLPGGDQAADELVTMEVLAGLFGVDEGDVIGVGERREELLRPGVIGELGKRYHIRGELGRGGVGRVSLAVDRNLGRELAVKTLLHPESVTRSQVRRFMQEARITAQLDHPSVVPVYELGITRDGELYYTMKRVEGISLSRILRGLRRKERRFLGEFSSTRLLRVFQQICLGLAYAHDRGVVHGDIKPQNVMIGAYGEVLLMDWGFASIIGGDVEGADGVEERPDRVFGTPGYVAPERVRGQGRPDPLSDLYSLGCILFEILTLRRVFDVRGTRNLLTATVKSQPPRPSDVAPGRQVAEDLEDLCLACLAKRPERRPESARALAEALEAYLEGSQRREEAQKRVKAGRRALQRHLKLRERVQRAEELTAEIHRRIEPWRPIIEKGALLEGLKRLEQLRAASSDAYGEAVTSFESALSLDPDDPDARAGLADAYWLRFEEAEAQRNERDMALVERWLMMYDDGRYSVRIRGEGALTMDSEPTHAEVICLRYERRDLRLDAVPYEEFGRTPLRLVPLPMGSYLLVVRREGFRTTLFPLEIRRREHFNPRMPVRMLALDAVDRSFVHIPAGRFRCGGDPESPGALRATESTLGDYLIGRHPVTAAEYRDYLQAIQRDDPEEAARRAPKRTGVRGSLWELVDDRWVIPRLDRSGHRWIPSHPVIGVSWEDAAAYAAWRTLREGVRYGLPTDLQWEKAGRGADARFFPWGDWFDPSLCSMRDSSAGPACNRPVGAFPDDRSPFGVADMAGGVQEWCEDWFDEEAGQRCQRGGAWLADRRLCRLADRRGRFPWSADLTSGFRLVREMPPEP